MKRLSLSLLAALAFSFALAISATASGYANPELLIETDELTKRLADPDLRIVDLRGQEDYQKGHIPNAVHLNPRSLDDLEANKKGLPLPVEKAEAVFGELGIDQRTQVVAYDDRGAYFAARLFYVLEFFGHGKVQVLNGGITKWAKEGRTLTAEVPRMEPRRFVARPNLNRSSTAEDVLKNLKNPQVVIVDARSKAEYLGEDVRAQRGGRIPGAIHIEWKEHLTGEGTFKPAEELRRLYEGRGVTKDKEVLGYCQSAVRSSHTYLALRLLGYEKVRNYDGSWQEWGNNPDLPIER